MTKQVFISPDGRQPTANDHNFQTAGNIDDPFNITYLTYNLNLEGNEIILLPGNYTLNESIRVYSRGEPLVIRAQKRWTAFIDSTDDQKLAVNCNGGNVVLWGLVIRDLSVTDRRVTEASPETDLGGAVYFQGENQQLRNCIIENLQMGVGFWASAPNFIGEGNIIYNIGFYDETSGRKEGTRGHICYGQTDGVMGSRWAKNIMWGGLNHGLHCYSQSGGKLDNLNIEDNIMFATKHRAALVGGTVPFKNLEFKGNVVYDAGCQIGFMSYAKGSDIRLMGNMFLETSPNFVNLSDVTLYNNVFVPKSGTVFFTLAPNEKDRFNFDGWSAGSGNNVYMRGKNPSIGRQVQNGGTAYQTEPEVLKTLFDNIDHSGSFTLYRYIEAAPGLVYYMYYHAQPKEETEFFFDKALGDKVNIRNVLDPTKILHTTKISESGKIVRLDNEGATPNPAPFLGGSVVDMLPDPRKFGVFIFEVVDSTITEPEPEPDTDVRELAYQIQLAAASFGVSMEVLVEKMDTISEVSQDLSSLFEDMSDEAKKLVEKLKKFQHGAGKD